MGKRNARSREIDDGPLAILEAIRFIYTKEAEVLGGIGRGPFNISTGTADIRSPLAQSMQSEPTEEPSLPIFSYNVPHECDGFALIEVVVVCKQMPEGSLRPLTSRPPSADS